ncbi:MAG: hypothetical protein ACAH17_00790, partial [Candidatus Paceibacterota bacterium]
MSSIADLTGFNPRKDTPLIYIGERDEPGVYIDWDRSGRANVAKYEILQAATFDGTYTLIDSVDFPTNEYVHEEGRPEYYYKIRELDADDEVLGTSQPIIGEEILVRASLRYQIQDFLKLRVFNERAEFNERDRKAASFTFENWNYWPRPVIRIDAASNDGLQDPMLQLSETSPITTTLAVGTDADYPDGLRYKLDYQGRAYFIEGASDTAVAIQPYNRIEASYAVRAFTCQQMNNALNMALQELNALP